MIKKVRRDKLKRDILKGLYLCKCNYRYTDDYLYDAATDFGKTDYKPVNIMGDGNERDYDKINLYNDDFSGRCGGAWENEDGTITLVIHSNLSYEFKKAA